MERGRHSIPWGRSRPADQKWELVVVTFLWTFILRVRRLPCVGSSGYWTLNRRLCPSTKEDANRPEGSNCQPPPWENGSWCSSAWASREAITWTASTVSFQDEGASELSFIPLEGSTLARRLITPSPGPTLSVLSWNSKTIPAHLMSKHYTIALIFLSIWSHLYVQLMHETTWEVNHLQGAERVTCSVITFCSRLPELRANLNQLYIISSGPWTDTSRQVRSNLHSW